MILKFQGAYVHLLIYRRFNAILFSEVFEPLVPPLPHVALGHVFLYMEHHFRS